MSDRRSDEDHGDQAGQELAGQELAQLEEEVLALRHRLGQMPARIRTLEGQIRRFKAELTAAHGQNEKLTATLSDARQHIATLRDEVDKLTRPPLPYGTLVATNDDGTVDVSVNGRKMRVEVDPSYDGALQAGDEITVSNTFAVLGGRKPNGRGEIVTLKNLLDDGRAVVTRRSDEDQVVGLSGRLEASGEVLRPGDSLLLESRSGLLLERLPKPEVSEVVLEEVPDVEYDDVGGLEDQIEEIRDAVELPFLHRDLFGEYCLPAPKGILLYGPPGCGKTLIAKAVANSLSKKVSKVTGLPAAHSYFLNIKGPELLNKYVGETERQLRLVFQRAREKAEEGVPVIVFFDEMDSLFRTRGSGISSDMESTVVPQLLAEIDGVEGLRNVIVIGASNREDLIDPAILRPGRLDVKIKIERPDAAAAERILSVYMTSELPLSASAIDELGGGDPEKAVRAMIEATVEAMFGTEEENRFLEVTYASGAKELLYFKDFASGAMLENIVRRAKKRAIKREIAGGPRGIDLEDLTSAIRQEFREYEDLPNTTNPDDWLKISGKKGERITYVRTLIHRDDYESSEGGKAIERVSTGNYL